MNDKKCIVFEEVKTQQRCQNVVTEMCSDIKSGRARGIMTLQRLCGAMCYSSLFLISEYELSDKQRYTFENVCYHVPGLLKIPLHDMLECLSDVCIEGTCITECLRTVLHECMYAETVSLLKLNTVDTYCALLLMYCHLMDDSEKIEVITSMWNDDHVDFYKIWTYYEGEIYNAGKGLF